MPWKYVLDPDWCVTGDSSRLAERCCNEIRGEQRGKQACADSMSLVDESGAGHGVLREAVLTDTKAS